MRELEPYYERAGIKLYHADCLEALPDIASGSVHAVITDPPYGINTKSDGNGKLNPWADLCNSALWYRHWIGECRRVLAGTGCLWSFLNWRSLVTFQKAACDLGWPIESLLVWDKEWIGPGGSKGLRPSYELVALWCRENFAIDDRGLPDIQRWPWSSHKPNGHPAEKPQQGAQWLVENSTKVGETVLDLFCGSGTTLAAAFKIGRNAIGFELDEQWAEATASRLDREISQGRLFTPEPSSKPRQLEIAV